jgi:hypothetical protein
MNEQKNMIIYKTVDGKISIALFAKDGMVWMNQNQLAELFDTSVPNISMHISNILKENELQVDSVVKDYLTTAADGKNKVEKVYETFNSKRKSFEAQKADENELEELKRLEKEIKKSK